MSNPLINAERKLKQGKLGEAHKLLVRALKKEPDNPKVQYLIGETLLLQNRTDESINYLMKAVSSRQAEPCWYVMCGVALERKGQYADAEKSYRFAEMAGCDNERMYYMIGNFNINITKNYSKAEIYLSKLIAKKPDAAIAYMALSRLYILQERYEEALQALDQCLQLKFETPEVYINLSHALSHQGRQDEALSCNQKALELDPNNTIAIQNYLVQLLYTEDDQQKIYTEVRKLTHSINKRSKTLFPGAPDCTAERQLTVGFVSADLRHHAISHYFKPILECFDRERFSLNFYYNNHVYDDTTHAIKKHADLWRETAHLDDKELVNLIRGDQVDILIDLSNHTVGNRLLAFTQRPAPMQVSWMGLPITTGLDCMDYALKDQLTIETCQLDKNASEKMLPVDNLTFYNPISELPPLSEPPCLRNGYVTFGSFNVLRKINQRIMETWAKIVLKLPESRIRMVIEDYNNATMQEHIYEIFAQHGVDRSRVELKPSLALSDYMASHNEVDIALDPYPYHGQTTSFNSLLMGLPLVSCCGNSVASNYSRRILNAIDKQAWLAENLEQYVDIALRLAQDKENLSRLRKNLRQEVQNSSLTDYQHLAKDIESALLTGWDNLCKEIGTDQNNNSK
ncbi:MAG: tetratricopeptide repeat protein [Chromatiales bacterium]|nr:tetratricopeptide repeat protein [Chromatiales bacterium]